MSNRGTPRRTKKSSRKAQAERADRAFFLAAGLFCLVAILILAALALFAW